MPERPADRPSDAASDPRAGLSAFYDLSRTFPDDVPFYLERLPPGRPRVLELGCGTGRVSLPLARRAGVFVGVDHSAEMASVCEHRLAEAGLDGTARIIVADITDLDLGETFDLVVAPFRVLQNLETDVQVARLFAGIGAHLAPEGRCVLNAFRPRRSAEEMVALWRAPAEDEVVWQADTADGRVVRLDRRAGIDLDPLVLHPELVYRTYRDGELVGEVVHRIVMRCWYPQELLDRVRAEGFAVRSIWGGYHGESWGEGPELVVEFALDHSAAEPPSARERDVSPEFGMPPREGEPVPRRSAYALVRDVSGRFLVVKTRHGLFLPGGGCEEGEPPERALVREVREETGYGVARLEHRGSAVQHFVADGVPYRMTTDFYGVTLGERGPGEPEHETAWLELRETEGRWYHASHAWAAREASSADGAGR